MTGASVYPSACQPANGPAVQARIDAAASEVLPMATLNPTSPQAADSVDVTIPPNEVNVPDPVPGHNPWVWVASAIPALDGHPLLSVTASPGDSSLVVNLAGRAFSSAYPGGNTYTAKFGPKDAADAAADAADDEAQTQLEELQRQLDATEGPPGMPPAVPPPLDRDIAPRVGLSPLGRVVVWGGGALAVLFGARWAFKKLSRRRR